MHEKTNLQRWQRYRKGDENTVFEQIWFHLLQSKLCIWMIFALKVQSVNTTSTKYLLLQISDVRARLRQVTTAVNGM